MSSHDRIPPQLWMLVPVEERVILAEAFNIHKTGVTEIRDQQIVTDGYTVEDLAAITTEGMMLFVSQPETESLSFPRLWELTVAKARSIAHPPGAFLASDGNGGIALEAVVDEPTTTKPTAHARKAKS